MENRRLSVSGFFISRRFWVTLTHPDRLGINYIHIITVKRQLVKIKSEKRRVGALWISSCEHGISAVGQKP
jgi:hypothetical protein